MIDPTAERPLDDAETRELRRIEKQLRLSDPTFAERLGSTTPAPAPARLRWFHVAAVMLGTVLFVAATTVLPERATLLTLTLTLLVVVPAGCVVWAWRRGDL